MPRFLGIGENFAIAETAVVIEPREHIVYWERVFP